MRNSRRRCRKGVPTLTGGKTGGDEEASEVGGLSCPGDAQLLARFFLPRQAGFPVVVLVVGVDLKGAGPAKRQSGEDIDGQTMDSGKGQGDFFLRTSGGSSAGRRGR